MQSIFTAPRLHYQPNASPVVEYRIVRSFASTPHKKRIRDTPDNLIPTTALTQGPLLPLSVLLEQPWPSEPRYLAALNPHPFDFRVSFRPDTHTYIVAYSNSDKLPPEFNLSVSSWYKLYFPPFNEDQVIKKMRQGKNWITKAKAKGYLQMNDEQIKNKWKVNRDTAKRQGTFYHLLLENHCNGNFDLTKYSHLAPIRQYIQWRREYFDLYFEEFRTEMRFYSSPDLRIVGTPDLIAIRKNHPPPEYTGGVLTLSIFDWKFVHELKRENPYENGFGPCKSLPNANMFHFFVQLNSYAWELVTFYGEWEYKGKHYTKVEVEFLKIVVFHDFNEGDKYIMVDALKIPHIIDAMIEERRIQLAQQIREYHATGKLPNVPQKQDQEESC